MDRGYHYTGGLHINGWIWNPSNEMYLCHLVTITLDSCRSWATIQPMTRIETHTPTHTHTAVLWLSGLYLEQAGWAGTRRNIHPLTPIVVVSIPYLLLPSITIHGILPVQFTCLTVFFDNLSPSFLWSTFWPGTLHFILHTFLHPIIVFFS